MQEVSEKLICDLCHKEAVYIIEEVENDREITRYLCEEHALEEANEQKRNTSN